MEQGDIVITNYPFSNLKQFKTRPALIISNNEHNQGDNRILVAISTKGGSYAKKLDNGDLSEGELIQDSFVRYSRIMSMHTTLL
ncbi:MAG: type II toxin-antitoxin system PemK/MazF family toxin, partial [Candidatus Gracilibacteria bacterium]